MKNDQLIKVNSGLEKVSKQIAITNKILQSIEKAKDEIEMVFVEGGDFNMGSDDNDTENPLHAVKLKSYFIGKNAITRNQWDKVMGNGDAINSNSPLTDDSTGFIKGFMLKINQITGKKHRLPIEVNRNIMNDNLPVTAVSMESIKEFILKLNHIAGKKYRLPTEAEWEFAARGGKKSRGYKHSGSNNLNDVGWFNCKNIQPVGQKKPNELGIYDMSGNVAEWCADKFRRDYYEILPPENPCYIGFGDPVVRGGTCLWENDANSTISARSCYPSIGGMHIGFRIACDNSD